ncbi:MAG: shikimate dehydrogenase [Microcystis sp. M040S2]|uniref:shikimate dehydrogenase n=1 Tax=unclassified Microcystis TaxID=2643300 RepID=UPI002A2C9C73|nr:shikimate dehydrogenase [Microcystis sp. M099S2]MCA2651592.1 shikimate dehydrogenase [Microcystis sp. M065S2]MCA2681181.1 shikimate dehydrogenase [Microcystis sp. M043S2]MCA2698398.1 shikimate dehydrogenase [Microcystis sp. M040S2]MCA2809463.1 shikimate dehydrogenase [Microcystis sp. M095S1]MCA2823778.1 shikimate dehydrogenase [Microcystis sp. M088S1]MCA2827845.1 shikimate dehydrogenase [Microcystis sp. M086S1]MCA2851567.1 shikimate dehydrogenase [Microcystis sp. M076S1]MCA2861007.1 shik
MKRRGFRPKIFDDRFDRIDERLNKVEIGLATLTEKVRGVDKRLEKVENEQATMIKAISDLQGFRGLILPINVGALSATIGAVITVAAKMLLIGNSP